MIAILITITKMLASGLIALGIATMLGDTSYFTDPISTASISIGAAGIISLISR